MLLSLQCHIPHLQMTRLDKGVGRGCNYIEASEAFLPLRNTSGVKHLPQSAPLHQIQKSISTWGSPCWSQAAICIFNIMHCLNACWIKLQHYFLYEKAKAYSTKIFHTHKHTSINIMLYIFVCLTPIQNKKKKQWHYITEFESPRNQIPS